MTNEKKSDSEGYVKFVKAISGFNDEISIILRCHLLTEYYLEQIIALCMERGDLILTKGRFTYGNKLLIVQAINVLKAKLITGLSRLNKIRNSCSHQRGYKVTEANIDLIGHPFGKDYFKIKSEKKDLKQRLVFTLMIMMTGLDVVYTKLTGEK